MRFDFDRVIPREGSDCLKWDGRKSVFKTDDVIPLWVADMDFAVPEAVSQALVARAAHPVYGYSLISEAVYESLIDWQRIRHQWPVERDWILPAPGVVPSLHAAVLAYSEVGEGVIVQPPVYFPFFSAVTGNGRRMIENPLVEENGRYRIDFEHFERCAADARLLLLCSPHNPVGRVWQVDELRELLRIARKHRLVVLSDEIHHDLIYPGQRHIPLATLAEEGDAIVTAVAPSKTFNIPGLGLSALIAPDPQLREKLRHTFEHLHFGGANPFSTTAFTAAYRHGAVWLDALMAYLAASRDEVTATLARELPGIRVVAAEGTYLLWLDCRGFCRERGLDDEALKHFLVREARVGMSPGSLFGQGGVGYMRLNLGAPRALIREAVGRIVEAARRR
jgi:cystathionine beta-lyase